MSHCSLVRLQHRRNFHSQSARALQRSQVCSENVLRLTEAPAGSDNLNQSDNLHRWRWQLWGPGAHLDLLQEVGRIVRTMYTFSREGQRRKGARAEVPAVPLVCLGWHTPDVTFMSPIQKPGPVTASPSHEMSQEPPWG